MAPFISLARGWARPLKAMNWYIAIVKSRKQITISKEWSVRIMKHQLETQLAFQPAITCSKLTIETLEQGVKYVQC